MLIRRYVHTQQDEKERVLPGCLPPSLLYVPIVAHRGKERCVLPGVSTNKKKSGDRMYSGVLPRTDGMKIDRVDEQNKGKKNT